MDEQGAEATGGDRGSSNPPTYPGGLKEEFPQWESQICCSRSSDSEINIHGKSVAWALRSILKERGFGGRGRRWGGAYVIYKKDGGADGMWNALVGEE